MKQKLVFVLILITLMALLFGCVNPSGFPTFREKPNAVICEIDEKPVIRMFSTTTCKHCNAVKDAYDSTVKEYVAQGKIVAYHWQFDTLDDTLTEEKETSIPEVEAQIFSTFNPNNGVPTFVFGCKYYRIGNGYESKAADGTAIVDANKEITEFRAVIDKLLVETIN